jgi:iron uptake system component EfeO
MVTVVRGGTLVTITIALCAGLASCGSSSASGTGASQHGGSADVDIVITPAKCTTQPSTASAGVVNFNVSNKNAPSVTEVELRQADGYLLAEQPNLAPGVLGGISADLADGTYQIYCPGADQTLSSFTVTGVSSGPSWKKNPQLVSAVQQFSKWMSGQMGLLSSDTAAFASAVQAGNLTQAETLYVPAREDYESVEAASEAYGSLYPDIDGQIEVFGNPSQFEGFHELEESMWVGDSLAGQPTHATQLLNNVDQLQKLESKATYQPAQIGDFASSQLTEASNFLVTGSEERYSNLELVDLKGTLDSAEEAITVLEPALTRLSPSVLAQLNSAMATASAALAQYAQSPGEANSGYVSFTAVGTSQRETLAEAILNLAGSVYRATQLVA